MQTQKNSLWIVIFLSIVAVSFVLEYSKANKENKTKTISFWHYWSASEKIPLENLVQKFNSENHGFKVNALSISMPRKKIMTAIVGNVAPDLVHLSGDVVIDFALRNALSEIPLNEFNKEEFTNIYLEMLNIKGKQWAIPYMAETEAMYLNKKLLHEWGIETPKTLDDIVRAFDISLEQNDGAIAFIPSWPSWFGSFLPGYFGGSWVNAKGEVTANSKENIEAWQWIEKNFVSKIPPEKILSFTEGFNAYQSPDNPFYAGKVAIEASGVWEHNLAMIYSPDMDLEVAPFPGTVKDATYVSVNSLAIPRNAKNKKEALEFTKWLLEKENIEYLALAQRKFTPYKEHSEKFFKEHKNPFINIFIDLAKSPNAQYMPQLSFLTRYKKEISSAYDQVIRKQKTAQEALDELQEKMIDISSL